VVDKYIIGATRNWEDFVKKYVVLARLAIGKSPRAEANALNELIAAVGLHILSPDRWPSRAFSPELIPALQRAREVLGLGRDQRFEGIM
jgi:hypothetical protein